MSKHDADDRDMQGYLLPEDSHYRLAKLRDYMGFLSRLAQPRTAEEEQESLPEVRMDELAICLELLAEQADLILTEVSWPAVRRARAAERDVVPAAVAERDAASDGDDEGDAASGASGASDAVDEGDAESDVSAAVDERFVFGLTLDQVDTLDRLIQAIPARGDSPAADGEGELADHTALMEQAIHDAAVAVRAILDQVKAQRLGHGARPQTGVGEERGSYAAELTSSTTAGGPKPVLSPPAHRPPVHARQPGRGRLH